MGDENKHTGHVRAYRATDVEVADGELRFVAATENVGRDKLILKMDGAKLENYRKNPVVLWGHDYGGFNSPRLPIGRATVEVDGSELHSSIKFDMSDPFAAEVYRKYQGGFLSAVSVGWETLEIDRPDEEMRKRDVRGVVTSWDLLDISAVPVPGDPDALKERQARMLSDLGIELIRSFGTDDETGADDVVLWQGVAVQMVRTLAPHTGKSDADRRREYNALEKRYRLLGKSAPEFMAADALESLGPDELRGLFFEGEPDLFPDLFTESRAGAVLSSRNRADLEDAITKIQGVIERASKEQESDSDDKERSIDLTGVLEALKRDLVPART